MTIILPVTLRNESTNLKTLRANGSLPAVVYGSKQEPIAIELEAKVFDKIKKEAGESTIIELSGLKGKVEVLIKDVEFNPIKNQIMHVDFYAVEQGKEMTTHVGLEFIGEAPVEQSKLGSVNKVLHEVEVTCLPSLLPNHIDVDLASLVDLESKILIKDLKVAKGVAIHGHEEDPVVVVSAVNDTTEGEELVVDMTAIEVEKKGGEKAE